MNHITFALIAGALTVGVAAAQETDKQRRDPKQAFSRMDSNADGKIDLNEFLRRDEERRTAFFKKLDANADGSVTAEEFQAFAGKHHRRQRAEQPEQK